MVAKAHSPEPTSPPVDTSTGRPHRLRRLSVKNFRCIGSTPVVIELDDIVVLVGPNNAGKSSILRAYQVVMGEGSNEGKLELDDFPNCEVDPAALPEIELDTIVYDFPPGPEWLGPEENSGRLVRERWGWTGPGAPKRQGFDFLKNEWSTDGVPWGAPNVAQAGRPKPYRVDAFADPNLQANEVVALLTTVLTQRVTDFKSTGNGDGVPTDYDALLKMVGEAQAKIVKESQSEITKVEAELTGHIQEVFPDHEVRFDARPEDDLEKCVTFFKSGARLLMGPTGGHKSTVQLQGSGARRTLLWSALRIIAAAQPAPKKKTAKEAVATAPRSNVLLIDEPEICLHPDAIREACRVLYDLPNTGTWQVMATTHSPVFIDVSRDNTTIVRVERSGTGEVHGTTVFRPERARLDGDDRAQLKLLNLYDPYVGEFFFGGKNIVVEGDTEYAAFRYISNQYPEEFRGVHVIRARGKATIVSLAKILNQFGTSYGILHDSDKPTLSNGNRNGAWTLNESIRIAAASAPEEAKVRVVASRGNFEEAFLGEHVEEEKPYNAIAHLSSRSEVLGSVRALLAALVDHSKPLPEGAVEWTSLEDLEGKLGGAEMVKE